MPYTIKQGETTLSEDLRSFLLYFPFTVAANSGVVTVARDGYFAFHLGWNTRAQIPAEPAVAGAGGDLNTFTVESDAAGQGSFGVSNAALIGSIKEKRSNETSRLYLFQIDQAALAPADRTWLNLAGWTYNPQAPEANEDASPFDGETISFGSLDEQHLFKVREFHENSLKNLSLSYSFVNGSALGELQAAWAGAAQVPALTINAGTLGVRQGATYLDEFAAGQQTTGFVLVAQGAFKGLSVEDLREWNLNAGVPGARDWTLRQCAQCVNDSLPAERQNSLENIDESGRNLIPTVGDEGPIEVLYIENIPDAPAAGGYI